jgi:hypothetical protein
VKVVIFNGGRCDVADQLTYDEFHAMACGHGDGLCTTTFTVTWYSPATGRSGELAPGHALPIEGGMIVNAMVTGRS